MKGVVEIIKFQFSAFFLRNMRHIGIESVFDTKIGVKSATKINFTVFKGGIFCNIEVFHDQSFDGIKSFRIFGEAFEADIFFQKIIYSVYGSSRRFTCNDDIFSFRSDDKAVIGKTADIRFFSADIAADMKFGSTSRTAFDIGEKGNDRMGCFVKILI